MGRWRGDVGEALAPVFTPTCTTTSRCFAPSAQKRISGLIASGASLRRRNEVRALSCGDNADKSNWPSSVRTSIHPSGKQAAPCSVMGLARPQPVLRRKLSLGAIVGRVLCAGGCAVGRVRPGSGSPEREWREADATPSSWYSIAPKLERGKPSAPSKRFDLDEAECLLAELETSLAQSSVSKVTALESEGSAEKVQPTTVLESAIQSVVAEAAGSSKEAANPTGQQRPATRAGGSMLPAPPEASTREHVVTSNAVPAHCADVKGTVRPSMIAKSPGEAFGSSSPATPSGRCTEASCVDSCIATNSSSAVAVGRPAGVNSEDPSVATSSSSAVAVHRGADASRMDAFAAPCSVAAGAVSTEGASPSEAACVSGSRQKPSRPPGKPPGPAPRSGRRYARDDQAAGSLQQSEMPRWQGPRPPEGWKSERVVNWQPIREPTRWQGSIWQEIYEGTRERGFTNFCDAEWKDAFMREVAGSTSTKRAAGVQERLSVVPRRLLVGCAAFQADLRHAQLARLGFDSVDKLRWVVSCRPCTEQSKVPSLPEEALDALLGMLKAAEGCEEALALCRAEETDAPVTGTSPMKLPASERLLQQLLMAADVLDAPLASHCGGRLSALSAQVADARKIARFPVESESVEQQIRTCIDAAGDVMKSAALPKLLEGVLLLGNFVNSSSRYLGGAVGITLDSLAKLAHTKCLPAARITKDPPQAAGRANGQEPEDNALRLLERQLRDKHGEGFVEVLIAELKGCREAHDLDPSTLSMAVRDLQTGVDAVQQRGLAYGANQGLVPPAFAPARLEHFLELASTRLAKLTSLLEELALAEQALRRHFAEPPSSKLPGMFASLVTLVDSMNRTNPGLEARSSPGSKTPRREHRATRKPGTTVSWGVDRCSPTEAGQFTPPLASRRHRGPTRRAHSTPPVSLAAT